MAKKIGAKMKILLVLLSAMMTFTIESKSKVTADGTWPGSMSASYACTYQKGDVRAKDTATLTVSGLDEIVIEKVDLYLKSNKDKGAGVITMTADGTQFYRAAGTYKDWFGEYNNTDYQAKGWSGEKTVNTLEVQVIGTVNSLHIEKYEITWHQTSTAYDVTLMNGTELVETLHGETVELPTMPDSANWVFVGWSEVEYYETENVETAIYTDVYKPKRDVTLWAIYRYQTPLEDMIVTDLQDGTYLYADLQSGMAMSGAVSNGVAGTEAIDVTNTMQRYEVHIQNGLATIRLSHVYGEAYIGFNGTALADVATPWQIYHAGQKTAFYTTVGEKIYMLVPNRLDTGNETFVTRMILVGDVTLAETVLLYAELEEQHIYTCHPEYGMDVEFVNEGMKELTGEWIIPFGNYELIIREGKKYLRLK